MAKTFSEINKKIKKGKAVVLTAEEVIKMADEEGISRVAEKVDVVTTGTFGPMCSSGAFLNFGHSDPPVKMSDVLLNDVPAYGSLAAVDAYIGAPAISRTKGMDYGGAHVIEDLVRGKEIKLVAGSDGTDCYPGKHVERELTLNDLNQAYLYNPRNAYQNYACATNTSQKTLFTYMGVLTPNMSNATYCSAGQLSPLLKDPYLRTIGIGTRIFIGGTAGYVAWEGTQFNTKRDRTDLGVPKGGAATLAVVGDLKGMSPDFLRACVMHKYGVSLFVGIGIPIPVLDEEMARFVCLKDSEIYTNIIDYSIGTLSKPSLGLVSYEQLRSGTIEIQGKKVPTASISSYKKAREIAQLLKEWIMAGTFTLSKPVAPLPSDREFKTLKKKEGGEN
ncbi:MAG: homocysteine biosynthesis protein [Candidatus Eremiobacterota bacterium]